MKKQGNLPAMRMIESLLPPVVAVRAMAGGFFSKLAHSG